MYRHTKIVATIGPSSQDEDCISQLIQSGLDVVRVNFSHGDHETHRLVIQRLRHASEKYARPLTILQDLQGPKIRTGDLVADSVELIPGQELTLTTQTALGDRQCVSVDFSGLPQCVQPGGRILIDDGNLELKVDSIQGDRIQTRVIIGGELKPHKGVNLPGAQLDIPGFTEKDRLDLEFGLQLGVDSLAVSFVRTADDVHQVRQAVERFSPHSKDTPIIAKLERPEALDNLEEIVHAADGVMVARGDLGVEMVPESVPIAQKRIIASANKHAKVVITATQMLDSMINNPRPTRAEASDVANAIFDGTDAVMLSGETAVGKHPIKAVEMMNAIICQAESHMTEWGHWDGLTLPGTAHDDTYYMTRAARELAHDRNVAAIVIFTKSGRTALLMSKTRPEVPILAFTPEPRTYQRLCLYWGVTPCLVSHADTIEEMLTEVEELIVSSTSVQPGQQVVLICGYPVHEIRPTNMALLYTVGEAT